MSLEEAILDKVRRLLPAKQEAVLRFADGLQQQAAAKMVPFRDRTRELKWIDEHRADPADQWVAVEGDRLLAAGADPLKVFATAKAEGIEVPFVVHVLPKDPLPFVPGRYQSVELIARLDTGAASCIFERKYAEMLGLNAESGRLQRFRTMAGSLAAYEHGGHNTDSRY